jgi:hypothetical protein
VDEQVPVWAQELIREVTILNERLPNHIDTTERRISDLVITDSDQEKRIRNLEQFRYMVLGAVSISGLLGAIISKMLGI